MTTVTKPKTLKARISTRIARSRADVFVPRDFGDLGEYDQVKRLRVSWGETQVVRDYNAGRTTQVQANSAFAVRGRFSRKLKYKNLEAQFERANG